MKEVVVLGLGESGKAAIKLLHKVGSKIRASDINKDVDTTQINDMVDDIELGRHSINLLNSVDLIVTSPGIDIKKLNFVEKIKNIPIISEIELAYRILKDNIKDFLIIAITGTNGKTTTTTLLYLLLNKIKKYTKLGGNIGTPFSEVVLQLLNEKPIQKPIIVLEVSSFQLDFIENFKPDIGVFLNFAQDHLDRHLNMADYLNSKLKLFKNQTSKDFAVLNADDPIVKNCQRKINSKILFFSKDKKKCPEAVSYMINNEIFLYDNYISTKNNLNLKGEHNIDNILSTLVVLSLFKESTLFINAIRKTIEDFKPLPHRLELVTNINGINFINDSKATNPSSTYAAISSFDNTRLLLILGGKDKNLDFSILNPILNKKRIKSIIIYGEAAAKIKQELCFDKDNLFICQTLKDAVLSAYNLAEKNDTILFSPGCSSFDTFQDYKERGESFKKEVFKLIKK